MRRSSALVKKPLAQTEPGELIRYSFGEQASLLLFLERREENSGLFGVITSPAFSDNMATYEMCLDGYCLSYGFDWFLEEIHGPETTVGGNRSDQTISLVIDVVGAVFVFRPENRQYGGRPTFFDVSASKIIQNFDRQKSAPVMEWRLWESEDHCSNNRAVLFEIPSKHDA